MSLTPRPLPRAQLEEVRESARRQAQSMSGLLVAVVVAVLVGVAMVAFIVLDYRFDQPVHRLLKILGGVALGVSILAKPWIGLLAYPVLTPFLGWIPPVPVPGLNTLNLLLGSVFTMWAVNRVLRGTSLFRSSTLGVPIALFVGIIVLSVVRGVVFPTGYVYSPYIAVLVTVRAAVSISVFYVALCMVRGLKARKSLLWAIVVGLAAEAIATIVLGRNGKGGRATGSIGQANELGAYLAICTPIVAAMLPAVRNMMGKLTLGAVVLLSGLGIVLSVSRAGIIGMVVALAYVGLRSSRALLGVLVLIAVTGPFWAPDFLKDRIMGTTVESDASDDVQLEHGAQLRIDTWRAMLQVVQDHPLDGVGFSGLAEVLPEMGEGLGLDVKDSSHNTFLRMVTETGVLGLGLFLWLLWKCWILAGMAMRAARTSFDRQLGVGLGAATIALVIACAFGDRFFSVEVVGPFWVLCALAEDVLQDARTPAGAAGAVGAVVAAGPAA